MAREDPLMAIVGKGLPDRVSPIGLGLAALGRPAYINVGHGRDLAGDTDVSVLEGRAHAVLDAAYSAGVRYFDTARGYGRAEEFLASWLETRGVSPGDVTVGSKWGYVYTADWRIDAESHEEKDLSVDNLRRQAAESRELLGDHLALYQIHSATLESGVLDDAAVRDELARLREQGLRIGFTVTGPAAAGDDRARARGWRLRHRSGDLEPARALGRARALGGARRRARRDRQGGARQRPPPRARPGHGRARCRARLSPGRTSSSAARRPSSSSRATCARSTSSTTGATTTSSRIRRPTGRPEPPSPGTEPLDRTSATPLHSRRTMFGNVEYNPSLTYRASGR